MNSEINFVVQEDIDGGFTARALGHSIFTEAETWHRLKAAIQDAVDAHFDEHHKPNMVRIHLENIVAGVCAIPANMSNLSFTTSVSQSGYREHSGEITYEQLVSYLRAHYEFIDSWLLWSMDKRSNGAFILHQGDHFEVGTYPPNPEFPQRSFYDAAEACATFILAELEPYRSALR